MTPLSENVYTNKLVVENNDNDHKSKVGDHVRSSKYKNVFAKGYIPNWSKKLKILYHGHMLLVILRMQKMLSLELKK